MKNITFFTVLFNKKQCLRINYFYYLKVILLTFFNMSLYSCEFTGMLCTLGMWSYKYFFATWQIGQILCILICVFFEDEGASSTSIFPSEILIGISPLSSLDLIREAWSVIAFSCPSFESSLCF